MDQQNSLPIDGRAESQSSPRVLRRSRTDRVLAGVCGGLGRYLGIDAIWVRIAFVVFGLASLGWGILIYVLLALAVPKEPFGSSAVVEDRDDTTSKLVGLVLVAAGSIFLLNQLVPFEFAFKFVIPLILVAVGVAILLRRD